jgi:GT2 family glycosyltransferase
MPVDRCDKPAVSVIVVSYNTRAMTLDCLAVLDIELKRAGISGAASEVWVVDNASSDGSVAAIRKAFPKTRIIQNETNTGFGAANNQAMRQAAGKYLLLLNSDAFLQPGAISAMMDYLNRHRDAAVVGPRLLNADGSLQRSCFRFPSPFRAWVENLWISAALPNHPIIGDYHLWAHDQERVVDFVIGACMLVRRAAYQKVGGFDERYFMYSEETDWQWRMHRAGWKIGFTPQALVTHLGGASGAGEKAKINGHFFNSLDYYERKNHGLIGLVLLRVAMVLGCSLRVVVWAAALLSGMKQRDLARSKLRLHAWLLFRQATHWRLAQAV